MKDSTFKMLSARRDARYDVLYSIGNAMLRSKTSGWGHSSHYYHHLIDQRSALVNRYHKLIMRSIANMK